ncbi:MAG: exo-alpha-sialidase, partial [Chloroflexaceae bacterium]|nr:exo-alpha-sialidase [Chloroflexaceae bacterium]
GQSQAQTTNTWSSAVGITPSSIDALDPQIVIDQAGVSHVVYFETNFSSRERVYYTNNRSGSWSTPRLMSEAANGQKPSIAYANVSGRNIIEVAWGHGSGLGYRRSEDGGETWSSEQRVTDHAGFDPDIIIDDTGTTHIVYTRGGSVGGEDALDVHYMSRSPNGIWSTPVQIDEPSFAVNGESEMAYTRNAGTLTLHVVYRAQRNWSTNGSSDIRVNYVRKAGNGAWERSALANSFAGEPDITSDFRNQLYVTLTFKQSPYDFEGFFFRSTDNGLNWQNIGPVSARTGDLTLSTAIGRNTDGFLAAVSSDQYNASRQDIYGRISSNNGDSWGGLVEIFDNGGISKEPRVGGGPGKFHAVWYDNASGKFRIFNSEYFTGPPPPTATPTASPTATPNPKPEGSIRLQGNISYDVGTVDTVNIQVTVTSGEPDQYRTSNDGVNWSELQALPASRLITSYPIDFPPQGSYGCVPRTVRLQLYDSALGEYSETLEDSIDIDPGVDVDVYVGNPALAQDDLLVNTSLQGTSRVVGAGDPRYTNTQAYYGRVVARSTECSGLHAVEFSSLEVDNLTADKAEAIVPLAQGSSLADGQYEVQVSVLDGVNNERIFSNIPLYLDSQPPQITSAVTDTVRILDEDGAPTTTTDSVFVDIDVSNLGLVDAGYGDQNPDRKLWGVLIANSTAPISTTNLDDLDALEWLPVEVERVSLSAPDDTVSFVVPAWNVFYGLDSKAGGREQYVCIRAIDGASNSSDQAACTSAIFLDEAISATGTQYLPFVKR